MGGKKNLCFIEEKEKKRVRLGKHWRRLTVGKAPEQKKQANKEGRGNSRGGNLRGKKKRPDAETKKKKKKKRQALADWGGRALKNKKKGGPQKVVQSFPDHGQAG